MSISGAMNNALSGLRAVSRSAEIVSSNVSNANTIGYGRREMELSSASVGGNGAGVSIDGVSRNVNQVAINDRRLADGALALDNQRVDFNERLGNVLGKTDDLNSLNGSLTQLETSLIEAASKPDSDARLSAVVNAAGNVVNELSRVSDEIQNIRMDADQSISKTVATLNDNLQQVEKLNIAIQQQLTTGKDGTALMDQRQVIIDNISEVIPLKEYQRDGGKVALISTGGAVLLEGKAAQFGFTPVGVIDAQMSMAGGTLNGLTMNGLDVTVNSSRSIVGGGELAGMFEVRDELAVTAQSQVDAIARDLVDRFQDPAVDPTLGAADAGLFTDNGLAFDPLDEVGLSGRLKLNAAVDPSQGGATWRIRSGINAATPTEAGDATLINAMADALTGKRVAASGAFSPASRSASELTGEFMSLVAADLIAAEADATFSRSQVNTMTHLEFTESVDTDKELQDLLRVEQAYAANARVIQTLSDLLDTLMGAL
jgi:flagellar hook-associated protein 1